VALEDPLPQAGEPAASSSYPLPPLASLYREPETPTERIDWPALAFMDVFKLYTCGPVETVALRGVDLDIAKGEMVAILGPSGSGKSTLLHLAAGLDLPSAGDVSSFGRSLTHLGERELAAFRARDTAIVFQSGNLWPALTAQENVATVLRLAGIEEAEHRAVRALTAFGLSQRLDHRVSALSGGEQQRVAIAAAAARRASIVLADEPTGELDAASERVVLEALHALRTEHECTIVMVTHSPQVAESADRVVEMRDGRVMNGVCG
jgi:putative ABC transport system ATP-binding protein